MLVLHKDITTGLSANSVPRARLQKEGPTVAHRKVIYILDIRITKFMVHKMGVVQNKDRNILSCCGTSFRSGRI